MEWRARRAAAVSSVRRDDDRRQVSIPAPRSNEAYHTRRNRSALTDGTTFGLAQVTPLR